MCSLPRILYCHCAYAAVVPKMVKDEVLAQLNTAGREFDMVADLCEMSARRDPLLKDYATRKNVKIVACFPRAVRGLFKAADAMLPENGIEILNMRSESPEKITQAILGEAPCGGEIL